jgi:hypothetical protein
VINTSCVAGVEAAEFDFVCPSLVIEPLCAWWDDERRGGAGWSTEGCAVTNVSSTAITCACNHLTDFGARFVALGDEQRTIFSEEGIVALFAPDALAR